MSTDPPSAEAPRDSITSGVTPTIHGRGVERLDAVVDLVHVLARARPITDLLDEVPRRVAAVFRSDVCSLYLREGDGLVMRGNVGFAPSALGEVRLGVGEGLVGMAVECLRPVSADIAPDHARFRAFSMLGEERFPAFLAVPVPGPNGAAGALVVQRRSDAYSGDDVALLMALAGAIAPLLERARIVASGPAPARATGTRRVTVPGRSVVPGRALGILSAVQRPSTRSQPADAKASARDHARALERALHACEATLDSHARAAERRGIDAGFLVLSRSILDDGRLRERTLELAKGRGLGHALAQVAREATRAARITDVPLITERAMEMSELCDALRAQLANEATPGVPKGAVWVGETVTVFDLLLASRAHPAALVLSGPVGSGRVRALVELIGVPTVCEAAGIYNWASDGDVALVDGDHGLVRVNPSRRERDEARIERGGPAGDDGHAAD
ncbi:MAG: GAF domain-containing protein [Deltaproteobacteria bacterium]|nr:GAF domain-containing protein [Myxococcales bacterium]MDP3215035.1 GAF domain-containing protein [Deltaproteobacteria bacterium]